MGFVSVQYHFGTYVMHLEVTIMKYDQYFFVQGFSKLMHGIHFLVS